MFLTILATLGALVLIFGGPTIWALYSAAFATVFGSIRGEGALLAVLVYGAVIIGQFVFTAWVIYIAVAGWIAIAA